MEATRPLDLAPRSKPGEVVDHQPVSEAGCDSVPAVLSFDVEEHQTIEAATGLKVDPELARHYHDRMVVTTEWILDLLHARQVRATFFVVGRIAKKNPGLIRSIHDAGHEVASHSWDHRRLHLLSPEAFREDTRKSKEALEQATGAEVFGFRAPTFSLVRQTAWALDILADLGFLYDSSIFPIYHDLYGVPGAPTGPFLACGTRSEILEIPPATLRLGGVNVPVGGGGYFRLLPFMLMKLALTLSRRDPAHGATMLYFHPWEFDPEQPRLPLSRLKRFRTYVGIGRSRSRLSRLLARHSFTSAVDLAQRLGERRQKLPRYRLSPSSQSGETS
jgi:polysaccharide deacetylase family protein (PEP-CTERM system associated)